MLLTIALVLLVLWALGVFAFHVTAGLIHIVLVVAIIVGLIHLFTGRRAL
ncbi:lmo0937 family membrane protein [Novosphingobium sp.]|nr:lmo0937 family membrane protein [Novosphingobium sp.]